MANGLLHLMVPSWYFMEEGTAGLSWDLKSVEMRSPALPHSAKGSVGEHHRCNEWLKVRTLEVGCVLPWLAGLLLPASAPGFPAKVSPSLALDPLSLHGITGGITWWRSILVAGVYDTVLVHMWNLSHLEYFIEEKLSFASFLHFVRFLANCSWTVYSSMLAWIILQLTSIYLKVSPYSHPLTSTVGYACVTTGSQVTWTRRVHTHTHAHRVMHPSFLSLFQTHKFTHKETHIIPIYIYKPLPSFTHTFSLSCISICTHMHAHTRIE